MAIHSNNFSQDDKLLRDERLFKLSRRIDGLAVELGVSGDPLPCAKYPLPEPQNRLIRRIYSLLSAIFPDQKA